MFSFTTKYFKVNLCKKSKVFPVVTIPLYHFRSKYRFPCFLKVEHFYDIFRKVKELEVKKQLLWDVSCQWMHRINQDKARILTDTVQSYGGLMLSVDPREGACYCHSWSRCQWLTTKQTLNLFSLFAIFHKSENYVQVPLSQ